jgi:hypothetical protein
MPVDIELSTLTAGGVHRPEAEWTTHAKAHVESAVRDIMASIELECLSFGEWDESGFTDEAIEKKEQWIRLHETVARAILLHRYAGAHRLPGKAGRLDWSLGPAGGILKEASGADYALFLFWRDSYATHGRLAEGIILAPLGAGLPMGVQAGYASMVELETGNVIWFNRLIRRAGDLRTRDAARSSTELLLSGFPGRDR